MKLIYALLELIELGLRHFAMGADPITPKLAGLRQFQRAREPAVVGQKQQALGVEIEPADADQPRQAFRQIVEHRWPAFRVGMGRHQAARLVIEEQPGALARRQCLPSTVTTSLAVTSSAGELMMRPLTVTRPCTIHSSASRREASPARDTTLAMRSPDFFSRGGAPDGVLRQPVHDRRHGRRTPDAWRRSCCHPHCRVAADRPVVTARMLLPARTALRSFARAIEFRAILARAIEFGRFAERAIAARPILARTRKT